ncbi:MAG: DUF4320 family protein [Bacillota bacterium]|nr:DUF4320 family protein [Bacillota bacterium]
MNTPSFGIYLMFFLMFTLFLPDMSMYFVQYQNVRDFTDALIEEGGKNGQIDQTLVDTELARYNLSLSDWNVTVTGGQVDYNHPIKVQVQGKYKLRAFYVIGQVFGDSLVSELPIKISREMSSQVFLRQ